MQDQLNMIFKALQRKLKAEKITYADLARRLGTTEAAIKNLFHSKSVSLERLLELCSEVGLSLGELLQTAGQGLGEDFELSEENERFFVNNPSYYVFFRELVLHRKSVQRIQEEHDLDATSVKVYLKQLTKMKLISIKDTGSVRYEVHGRHRWRVGGPWFHRNYLAVVNEQAKNFLNAPEDPGQFLAFGAFSLSRRDLRQFQLEIEGLVDKYKALALGRSLAQTDEQRLKDVFVGFNLLVSAGPHPTATERIAKLRA